MAIQNDNIQFYDVLSKIFVTTRLGKRECHTQDLFRLDEDTF